MKSFLKLAPLALLALGGCGQADKAGEPAGQATQAAPEAKPGFTVRDGVLILPVIAGRPGAAYFTLTNGGDAAGTLAAVTIEGVGKAEMHETKGGAMSPLGVVELKPGEAVKFERGGKHVMAFDIADTVKPGGTAELTLTFAGGDKVSTPLKVEAMGGTAMEHGN